MSITPLLSKILQLPPKDRLQLVEDIWESLAASPTEVPVPEWHVAEIRRRIADPAETATISWPELRARLRPDR